MVKDEIGRGVPPYRSDHDMPERSGPRARSSPSCFSVDVNQFASCSSSEIGSLHLINNAFHLNSSSAGRLTDRLNANTSFWYAVCVPGAQA